MTYNVIRGAAHANAMRADKMRILAAKLAVPLATLAEAGRGDAPPDPAMIALAHAALAEAREEGLLQ